MSIHFISGKPGGGKSYYAVKLMAEELLYGKRQVVTNMPLDLARINEDLQERWPDCPINLFERVRMLDDETETGTFFTVRPGCVRLKTLTKLQWELGQKPDYTAASGDGGALYIIDEVHNFFNARAWMETGRDVLFYLSQHRKLGDTVICVTQHIGNVDKQFRSVTQDYTYVRNMAKEKMGVFRMPKQFTRKTYLSPATGNEKAVEVGTFRLDVKGFGSWYNTAAGVGIHGSRADQNERPKGISWLWFFVAAPLVLYGALTYLPKGISSLTDYKPAGKVEQKGQAPAELLHPVTNAPAMPTPAVEVPMPKTKSQSEREEAEKLDREMEDRGKGVVVIALFGQEGQREVWLSNGVKLKEKAGEVAEVTAQHVVSNGTKYKMNQPKGGSFTPGKDTWGVPLQYPTQPAEPAGKLGSGVVVFGRSGGNAASQKTVGSRPSPAQLIDGQGRQF